MVRTSKRPKGYVFPQCLHCKKTVKPIESRGLCLDCCFDKSIRECYDIIREVKPSEVAVGNHPRQLPNEPTEHTPGTSGKVDVLIARAAADVALWHPLDAVEQEDGFGVFNRPEWIDGMFDDSILSLRKLQEHGGTCSRGTRRHGKAVDDDNAQYNCE